MDMTKKYHKWMLETLTFLNIGRLGGPDYDCGKSPDSCINN